MTRAKDIKAGMKFDNYGQTLTVADVRKAHGGVFVMWSGFFGTEFVGYEGGIDMPQVA